MSWDIDQEEAEECYRERAMLKTYIAWLLGVIVLLLIALLLLT